MSSNAGGSHSGGDNEDIVADEASRNDHARLYEDAPERQDGETVGEGDNDDELPQNVSADGDAPQSVDEALKTNAWEEELELRDDYAQLHHERTDPLEDAIPDEGPVTPQMQSPAVSPLDSGSIPDDTPSLHGSMLSSPDRGASPAPRKRVVRNISGALQPFERRFEARPAASRSPSSRTGSPAFLSPHSRQISLSSQISQMSSQEGSVDPEMAQAPWDVVRWTKLRNITGQAFSEAGKRNFGRPTCLAVSALIAIGTSRGLVLGFDYHQTLKIIVGQGTKATECGSVTALAIAADYSTIAVGHANGHIFTWEINRPSQPFLRIPPIARSTLQQNNHPDGHVENCAILHIGFLGTRHTALVSADSCGMAFSHLATRGLGPVTRTIKTTRLLGRYPPIDLQAERTRKSSSVLAFSPLPLGNVEQSTDNMGLTALLTPYLLVIVSTTPIAQTQYKAARPKDISTHSTLSGCLAWFPAVKLKTPGASTDQGSSDTKLVYCWSNLLTVLDVKLMPSDDPTDSTKPPNLEFQPRSRWRAEEAITAVQWLGRSILGVLTVSQRLLIVEDVSLQVTDSIDLLHRHIYHQDLFSEQLKTVVEQLNSADPSLHGVVADAFYMAFRVYKGRIFLLGYNDLTVGTLSNWADRLMALMEAGDHIAAIRLATQYYAGGAHNITVSLPDDDVSRHQMVRERLVAMISASLNYTFSQHDDEREVRLRELATVCFDACLAMRDMDYIFGEMYEMFNEADEEDIFVSTLEPFILDDEIKSISPEVVKTMVDHFISENQAVRLEELLCKLDPLSFDLDEITVLCRQHSLFDALIYIWTQGIGDFVTPLIDLMSVIKLLEGGPDDEDIADNPFYGPAMKTYPYLAYSLTGRRYPGGELLDDAMASRAKADVYEYLFSGTPTSWPPGSKKVFRTMDDPGEEPAFPYLVLLLQFDTPSFMSMLNEAFEDAFLNTVEDDGTNGEFQANGTRSRAAYKITRQHVVSILLDTMKQGDFEFEQVIYMDMFIARSLPKYPGQLVLSGSLLNTILHQLCRPPTEALWEECQLSVEYLLSAYHPPDVSELIVDLQSAKFFRVLKSVYRSARMLNELLEVYFEDPSDKEGVFGCIAFCLRSSTGLNEKQKQGIKEVVAGHFPDLADINIFATARTLAAHAFDLLQPCLDKLDNSHVQFLFLRAILESSLLRDDAATSYAPLPQDQQSSFVELYVRLMCQHDPTHVADYVSSLPTGNMRLDQVLPAMERSGVVDAAIVLLARDGLARDAMERLVTHLQRLQQTLVEIIGTFAESPDFHGTQEAAQDLVEDIEKYTKVGIWLCQGQSANAERRPRPRTNFAWEIKEDDLDLDEYLWLNLVDVVVQITKSGTEAIRNAEEHPTEHPHDALDLDKLSAILRSNVQQAFTALLAATATPNIKAQPNDKQHKATSRDHLSFLRVLRTFLTRAAATAPSIADLRAVLSDIFSAYIFEEGVLSLANDLLGSDVFADMQEANEQRQRGWRPRTQVCELCKRRAWGPGIGEIVWDEWVAREQDREARKARKLVELGGGEEARRLERGKAKAAQTLDADEPHSEDARRLALVVFACRHVVHRVCLDADYRDGKRLRTERYKCPVCTRVEGA